MIPWCSVGWLPFTASGAEVNRLQAKPSEHIVASPAGFLIVVSAICISCVLVAIAIDIYLLTSGLAAQLPSPSITMSKEEQIFLRTVWGIMMLITNGVILVGAVEMRALRHYALAKTAAVLAIIPCIGPCFVLGIPFGLMALSALHREDVKNAFRS